MGNVVAKRRTAPTIPTTSYELVFKVFITALRRSDIQNAMSLILEHKTWEECLETVTGDASGIRVVIDRSHPCMGRVTWTGATCDIMEAGHTLAEYALYSNLHLGIHDPSGRFIIRIEFKDLYLHDHPNSEKIEPAHPVVI
jgi:hypothetical protein